MVFKYSLFMGNDLCTNIDLRQKLYDCTNLQCCKSSHHGLEFEPFDSRILQRQQDIYVEMYVLPPTSLISIVQQNRQQGKLDETSPPEAQNNKQTMNLESEIQRISSIYQEIDRKQEIYLSVDLEWVHRMRQSLFEVFQAYQFIVNQAKASILERRNNDNQKIQILFRQHFPIFGVHYYQLRVHSYIPYKGCQLTFGIVDHLTAFSLRHCKGIPLEQSYTFKIDKLLDQKKEFKQEKSVNFTLKVEVCRVQKNIKFYFPVIRKERKSLQEQKDREQDKLQKQQEREKQQCISQPIKDSLLAQNVSIVPFLQTQYTGLKFSWRVASSKWNNATYKMSTIFEESSSNITH